MLKFDSLGVDDVFVGSLANKELNLDRMARVEGHRSGIKCS